MATITAVNVDLMAVALAVEAAAAVVEMAIEAAVAVEATVVAVAVEAAVAEAAAAAKAAVVVEAAVAAVAVEATAVAVYNRVTNGSSGNSCSSLQQSHQRQ
jgi:hypothetical protein